MAKSVKEKIRLARKWALKQYEKHCRHNRLYASPGVHDVIVVLDNLKPSYNVGKIFRSADAFGVKEVHLVGIDYFEVKSAKGSFKWVPAFFHRDFDACHQHLSKKGYSMHIMDPDAGTGLHQVSMPRKSAFIFGHEEFGISFDPDNYKNIQRLSIPQYGRVHSLNVSVAASVVMYEYLRQHAIPKIV